MIINAIICEKCGSELQPENLLVGNMKEGDLIRVCEFCGDEVIIE